MHPFIPQASDTAYHRDKISLYNQLGSMCPSMRLCVQSHGQDAGVSHAEGSAACFWGGGIPHPDEILEVLCPSWNAWEMIMHWLGLWVSCRCTLDALSSGPFPLPLVCSRIYQFHSSHAQLIPETGRLHVAAPLPACGAPSAAITLA